MPANAHAVNIASRPYHHGDLRAALLRAGLELIAARTTDDLSLREVARAVGVSANAVYRHFPDKQALMAALAAEGLQRLAAAQHAAAEAEGGGRRGFGATGRAYVRFAIENPALFRLIFATPAGRGREEAEAFAFLRANAAAAAGAGRDGEVLALGAWSLAHGLAMLVLDGQVTPDDAMLDAVFGLPLG